MQRLKAIIFDLGGVIIDLHEHRTVQYFAQLSGRPEGEIRAIMQLPAFQQFEKGLISETEFRAAARESLKTSASDEQIDKGWNAMLGEIPRARIDLLRSLANKYELYLLSNTNAIHYRAFSEIVRTTTGQDRFEDLFDQAYYSHEIHMRKPDPQIYEWVLAQNNLQPAETLFLDDNVLNIQGAQHVGIQTVHVTHPDLIFQSIS